MKLRLRYTAVVRGCYAADRSSRTGERIALSNGVELEVDAIFAGVMDCPGD